MIGWDPSGLVIGVACSETRTVALYDPDNMGKVRLRHSQAANGWWLRHHVANAVRARPAHIALTTDD